MRKNLRLIAALAVVCLVLPLATVAAAWDPFPFEEYPDPYTYVYNYDTFKKTEDGNYNWHTFVRYSQYAPGETPGAINGKRLYTQSADYDVAISADRLFPGHGPEAEITEPAYSFLQVSEERYKYSRYAENQYGFSTYDNTVSASITEWLPFIDLRGADEGKTLEETMLAYAEEQRDELIESTVLKLGKYSSILVGLDYDPYSVKMEKTDEGYLVTAEYLIKKGPTVGSTTYEVNTKEPPRPQIDATTLEENYICNKIVISVFTLPSLPGAFAVFKYQQNASLAVILDRTEEEADYAFYKETKAWFESIVAMDLARRNALDRSAITITWNEPVDERKPAEPEPDKEQEKDKKPVTFTPKISSAYMAGKDMHSFEENFPYGNRTVTFTLNPDGTFSFDIPAVTKTFREENNKRSVAYTMDGFTVTGTIANPDDFILGELGMPVANVTECTVSPSTVTVTEKIDYDEGDMKTQTWKHTYHPNVISTKGEVSFSYNKDKGTFTCTVRNEVERDYEAASVARDGTASVPVSRRGTDTFGIVLDSEGIVPGTIGGTEPQGPIEDSVTHDAEQNPGEDGGVTIPEAIAIGIAGAGASVVGAGAVVGGGAGASSADEKKKKGKSEKKSYKMYVSKDFGDAIKKGGQAVTVRARMAEAGPDGERDRDDMTAAISASASGLELVSSRKGGRYFEATVRAPEDAREKGTVTFTFVGAGGTFRNNVVFRIVDKPYIRFPEAGSSEGTWTLQASAGVNMILGGGETYPVMIYLEDAASEPKKLEILGDKDIGWEFRPAERAWCWYADLKNNTADPDKKDIFREKSQRYLTVRAEFEDGQEAQAPIYVELYPEGLSVGVRDEQLTKNRRLRVDTLGKDQPQGLDSRIPPTSFDLFIAVKDEETGLCRLEDNSAAQLEVPAIYGADEYGAIITENFRYELEKGNPLCAIAPQHTLPMADGPYIVELLLRASIGGRSWEGVLPLSIEGDAPSKPDTWDYEYQKLRLTIERFGLPSDPTIRAFVRNPRLRSANELQMVRRMILQDAVNYYSKEHREYMALDKEIGKLEMGANIIKWIGDQAFSYLIEVYGGGPVVEAFASPLKDMWAEFAGIYIGAMLDGEPVNYSSDSFYAAILQGIESTIGNVLTGEEPPTPKKLGYAVAGFMFVSFLKHYYYGEDEKGDIYKSMVAAGGDLSMNFFKNAVGDAFKSYAAKSKGTLKKVMDYLASKVPSGSEFDSVDMAAKYVTETLGLGGAWVYDKLMNTSNPINPAGGLVQSAKFEDDSWVISMEVGNYVIKIPLLENLMVVAEMFCQWAMAPFTALYRPVPVTDCTKVSDPGLQK
ncbi:MAG: hypothetical protein II794_00740 [Oscillospiraceae bacterium]|nr:hypothetical protein [Oscillospiraceae bacterium]